MSYYERNLPHWQPEGRVLFVTWRLCGSLPASAWARVKARVQKRHDKAGVARALLPVRGHRAQACPRPPQQPSAGEYFLAMDRELDCARYAPRWLRDSQVAAAVVDTLRRGETDLAHYRLHAFVVMPNHVHVLIAPTIDPVHALKGIKGTTAHAANRILGRTGQPFWQDESFDHWVRNGVEFERIRAYIERNPVTAGLVENAEDWPWSSAYKGRGDH